MPTDRRLAAVVLPLLAALVAAGEPPRLSVGPVVAVGPAGVKHGEPWIAANPKVTGSLVLLASRLVGPASKPSGHRIVPVAYHSADGGATWSAADLGEAADLAAPDAFFADACATFAPDGTGFATFCGDPKGDRLNLHIYRSDDGGRRWVIASTIVGNLDFPRLVADSDGGRPRLFVAVAGRGDQEIFGGSPRPGYGCLILRSTDRGRTFQLANFLAPTTLSHDPIDSPLVLPDGRLLVGFADYPDDPTGTAPRDHLSRSRTYTASSRDGGATFSLPAPIGENRFWVDYIAIAADLSSGPRRGRVYAVNYSRADGPPGLRVRSSDDGAAWARPTPVAGLPAGSTPMAAPAVSPRGVLGIVWAGMKPGDNLAVFDPAWLAREHDFDLWFTASSDGGATYAAPVRLASSRTDKAYTRWPLGGDYLTLACTPDGAFHPAWIDTRDARGLLRTATIRADP